MTPACLHRDHQGRVRLPWVLFYSRVPVVVLMLPGTPRILKLRERAPHCPRTPPSPRGNLEMARSPVNIRQHLKHFAVSPGFPIATHSRTIVEMRGGNIETIFRSKHNGSRRKRSPAGGLTVTRLRFVTSL